jgi:4-amino-4-deoxy-L-arabinose transferase-like glycosyltransferase
MWSTKPPLLIWLQVFFIKTLGMGELAIRMPSALAAVFTAFALLIFGIKYLKDFWFGFVCVLVLVTSTGYIHYHVSRTGDFDSLLTLFTTLYPMLLFAYIETGRKKFLNLFFIAVVLAVLTKGVQGFASALPLLLYIIFTKKFRIINTRIFYTNLFFAILAIAAFYLFRELYNPGYLTAVWNNELGGRYLSVTEEHQGSFWFYFKGLNTFQFHYWLWMVPCGIAVGLFIKNERIRRLTFLCTLLVITYLVTISLAKTKIEWYVAPIFPYLALLVSIFIYYIFSWLKKSVEIKQTFLINMIPYVFLFVIFLLPYKTIISQVYYSEDQNSKTVYELSTYLREAVKLKHYVTGINICYEGYHAHIQYYTNLLNDAGQSIKFKDWKQLSEGDKIITKQVSIQEYIESHYTINSMIAEGQLKIYTIAGEKQP